MRCLSCQYDLRNLSEHRCPECGRAFDPSDPRTYGGPHQTKQTNFPIGKAAGMKIGIALAVCLIVLVTGELIFTGKPPEGAMFYMLYAAGFTAVFYFWLKRYSK